MLQLARHAALFICSLDAERQTSVARPSPETSQKTPLKSQPTKADGDQSFGTHAEESDVVVDEVADHADLLRRLSLRLEQAGGEDRGQFFTWHAVEVATLLNPAGKQGGTAHRCHKGLHSKSATQRLGKSARKMALASANAFPIAKIAAEGSGKRHSKMTERERDRENRKNKYLYRCWSKASSVALFVSGKLSMKVEYFFTLRLISSSSTKTKTPDARGGRQSRMCKPEGSLNFQPLSFQQVASHPVLRKFCRGKSEFGLGDGAGK